MTPTAPANDEAAAITAVRTGDLSTLQDLLSKQPALASARLSSAGGRTLLHVATDWPGHLPDVAASIRALVAAGADPDAAGPGRHPETPLHWAASSDDVEAIDALLAAGADIDAPGASIGGGGPLMDATGYGQWAAAERLVARGARVTLWDAAALGLLQELERIIEDTEPTVDDLTTAFWRACHGLRPAAAHRLQQLGADVNWVGWDGLTPLDAAQRSLADRRQRAQASDEPAEDAPGTELLDWLRANGATSAADR